MYRRQSIGLVLRGLLIAFLIILVPILVFRALENLAYVTHSAGLEVILSQLYIPVIATSCIIALSLIFERLSIRYIELGKGQAGTIFGIATNLTISTAISIILLTVLVRILPAYTVYILVLGIFLLALVSALSVFYDRYRMSMIMIFIIYVSILPLIGALLCRFHVICRLPYISYIPAAIPLMAVASDMKKGLRRVLPAIALCILVSVAISIYVIYARNFLLSITLRHDPLLGYIVDSLIISLILVVGLIIINMIFKSDKPLMIELVEPFEKIIDIKLDALSQKVCNRINEFIRTGNRVPLLCSIVEIGRFLENDDNIENAVKVVEEYSDLKPPPLAMKWQIDMILYRNYVRRLALVRAVIDILRGEKAPAEKIREFSGRALSKIPKISLPGIVGRVLITLLTLCIIAGIIMRYYILIYMIPIVVMLIIFFSDTVVMLRRYLVKELVHTYNNYAKHSL